MQPRPPVAATEMQGSSKGLGSLAPPPLPPVRRTKSISSRSSDSGSAPPPPPPRKHKTNGIDSLEKPPVEDKDERTSDILVDLQKLQREVDELRGKYGSKATAGVAQAANKHQPDHSNLIMH